MNLAELYWSFRALQYCPAILFLLLKDLPYPVGCFLEAVSNYSLGYLISRMHFLGFLLLLLFNLIMNSQLFSSLLFPLG
jgi:hypothetical protein